MFCSECGSQVNNNDKFCGCCGAPIGAVNMPTPVMALDQQDNPNAADQFATEQKRRGSALKWIIPLSVFAVGVFVFVGIIASSASNKWGAERAALNYIEENYGVKFLDSAESVEKEGRHSYVVTCNIDRDYEFWGIDGTIETSVVKVDGEWVVDVEKENIDYNFKENENWYHISVSGNRQFLIKMDSFTQDEIVLEYYSYDMGSYNTQDDFDHDTTTCDLEYDATNNCFAFTFMGDWRINGSSIGYNEYEVGIYYEKYQSSNTFITKSPVECEDYWWYEKAKE